MWLFGFIHQKRNCKQKLLKTDLWKCCELLMASPKGMVHLVWIGGTGVLQSILSSLILKVYQAFAFKPITIKFGEFTYFWMLFQMTCSIFNLIDIECSHTEKLFSYPVPCSFRTWPIYVDCRNHLLLDRIPTSISSKLRGLYVYKYCTISVCTLSKHGFTTRIERKEGSSLRR